MAHGRAGKAFARLVLLGVLIAAAAFLGVARTPQSSAADGDETAFLNLINQYRAANGVGALALNGELTDSARWMSQDMAAHDYFSHTDSLGRDPFARMSAFGYAYNTWKGENLAAGASTAQQAFDTWKGSAEHNANMLSSNFTVIGIGRGYRAGSAHGWYWTTDFGGQGDPPPQPASVVTPAPSAPPPAPANRSAPQVPSAQANPPAPPPAPTATARARAAIPTPAPAARSAPAQPASWWQVALQLEPWWDGLTVVSGETSMLRGVSYLAVTYLKHEGPGHVLSRGLLLGGPLPTHPRLSMPG